MRWREHILDSKDSLLKCMIKRVGAMGKVRKSASFKTRKMIANGIFLSKLIYLMPVWITAEDYLINALQVCQNKVARIVAKVDRLTPTAVVLKQCGWLPVRHLMMFHSLVLLHKTIHNQTPAYLYSKVISGSEQPSTRQAVVATAALVAAGVPRQPTVDECSLELKKKSWCWSAPVWYNKLPLELKSERKMTKFKTRLKEWVPAYVE